MIKIRIHGRGGQGGKKLADMIAHAAFYDSKFIQSFAVYGAERRGAPVGSFVRIDDKKILEREYITDPDAVIILDKTLFGMVGVDVTAGLKENGLLIINSEKKPDENGFLMIGHKNEPDKDGKIISGEIKVKISTPAAVKFIDVTKIAIEIIKKPIFNTAMLGAFTKFSGIITLENAIKGAESNLADFPQKVVEANIEAIKRAYEVAK